MTQDPDVIIIGAGVAGLAAAQELIKHGMHPLVLEARDRVGGRVHTVQPWNAVTELGASWIHKLNNNPLTEIAKAHNLQIFVTEYRTEDPFAIFNSISVFDANGKKLDDSRVKIAVAQLEKFYAYIEENLDSYSKDVSFADVLQEYMQKNPMNQDSMDLFRHVSGDAGEFENGSSIASISVKNPTDIHSTVSGQDAVLTQGYAQILAQLVKNVPILLNTIVTSVNYDKDGVTVHTQNQKFHAKYAISTLPLGVLQAGTVKFIPALPKQKQESIKAMGVGTYNKIYLRFEKPFWELNKEWLVFLQENGSNDEFEILNYYAQIQQPILLAFTTGACARTFEKQTDQAIIKQIMQKLKKAYGEKTLDPSDYIITRWGQDPFAQGSYSYPSIGSSIQDYKNLAGSIENKVFFAGEATSWTDPSTVTGAYLSGIRAANELNTCRVKQK